MNTDDLIASLASDLTPVRPGAARRSLALGVVAGALAAVVLLAITYGLRPDLDVAMAGMMFWMKVGYTASLALIALAAATVLTRPEALPPRWLWLLAFPVTGLAAISVIELANAPVDHRMKMWFGLTWQFCPTIVVMLSLPVMAALMFVYRRFAPTHLRTTGAVIGLGAGALAATVYCLHCPESTATFVLSWYTLGIMIATGIGAVIGPRLLRW